MTTLPDAVGLQPTEEMAERFSAGVDAYWKGRRSGRDGDAIMAGLRSALVSVPAPSGAEPAIPCHHCGASVISTRPPQAVPAEDVAAALAEVDELERYGNATSRHIRAALTGLSAERDRLQKLVSSSEAERYRSCSELLERATASEAEATSLRKKLEEAERIVAAADSTYTHWRSRAGACERKLEEAYEECARIAEIDMRSPTAKSTGHKPEWYKHGLSIAKRIRNAATRALGASE